MDTYIPLILEDSQCRFWYRVPREFGTNYIRIHKNKLYELNVVDVYLMDNRHRQGQEESGYIFRVYGWSSEAITSRIYATKDEAMDAGYRFFTDFQTFISNSNKASTKLRTEKLHKTYIGRMIRRIQAYWHYFRTTSLYMELSKNSNS